MKREGADFQMREIAYFYGHYFYFPGPASSFDSKSFGSDFAYFCGMENWLHQNERYSFVCPSESNSALVYFIKHVLVTAYPEKLSDNFGFKTKIFLMWRPQDITSSTPYKMSNTLNIQSYSRLRSLLQHSVYTLLAQAHLPALCGYGYFNTTFKKLLWKI